MARKKEPEPIRPSLTPERAIAALRKQLERLAPLKRRRYAEADAEETGWGHLTQSIIEKAFGNPSSNLSKLYGASSAGEYSIMGISQQQMQANYELRIREFEVLLVSLIEELELSLPEVVVRGTYAPGNEYDFYRDLSTLVAAARREVFIVDAYLSEDVFNLYVEKITRAAARILTGRIGTNVQTVAQKYAKGRSLELRSSQSVHDRVVFIDDRGWVIGQSIKDAAKRQPTSIIELNEPMLSALRDLQNNLWDSAAVII